MKKLCVYLSVFAVLIVVSSCNTANFSAIGSKPIMFNSPVQKTTFLKSFRVTKIIAFDYSMNYDLADILSDQFAENPDADAIVHVRVNLSFNLGCVILNGMTFGLAQARSIEIKGELVKFGSGIVLNEIENQSEINISDIDDKAQIELDGLFKKEHF